MLFCSYCGSFDTHDQKLKLLKLKDVNRFSSEELEKDLKSSVIDALLAYVNCALKQNSFKRMLSPITVIEAAQVMRTRPMRATRSKLKVPVTLKGKPVQKVFDFFY